MRLSIFTDELGVDITDGIDIIRSWGLRCVDFRGRVYGKHFEGLDADELKRLRALVDDSEMTVACLQSSLAKVHLPGADRVAAEMDKLEAIIRAADALDCRMVRAFYFWQPPEGMRGVLHQQPDKLQAVMDMAGPMFERAKQAGLVLAFENCGCTVPECLAVLDALGVPEFGLAWDCANEYRGEGEPKGDALAERLRRSRCIHVKASGAVRGLASVDVPYERLLLDLAEHGFDGPVSIETHNPDKSVDNVEMSRRVLDRLNGAWPGGAPAATPKGKFDFEPLRLVVVGLGMGRGRAKQVQDESGAEVVGLVDIDAERAQEVGKELGIEATTDLGPWLAREDVDAVFVMTPTGAHAEVAIAALGAGKHVLTTKPMEVSVEACDRMIEAADKSSRLLAVDFARRLLPQVQRTRQRVARGDLGRFLGGTVTLKIRRTMEYFEKNGGWRGTWKMDGGGILSNQSIHHIDELVYSLGVPQRVCAHTRTQVHDIEAEDLGCAVWEYAGGGVLQIFATSAYPHHTWYYGLELHGEKGALIFRSGGPYKVEVERWFTGDAWEDSLPQPDLLPWSNLAQNLAAAVRQGAPLVCDGRDGRRSRLVLDAMYASARQDGAWVEVGE